MDTEGTNFYTSRATTSKVTITKKITVQAAYPRKPPRFKGFPSTSLRSAQDRQVVKMVQNVQPFQEFKVVPRAVQIV